MAKKPSKNLDKKLRPRNRHAYHPIMQKGGVHEKSVGAKRKLAKQELKHQLNRAWQNGSEPILVAA